jgi:hypothetical protein
MTHAHKQFLATLLDDLVALARPADVGHAGLLAVALGGEIDALAAGSQPDVPDAPGRAASAWAEAQQRIERINAAAAAACESVTRSLDTLKPDAECAARAWAEAQQRLDRADRRGRRRGL